MKALTLYPSAVTPNRLTWATYGRSLGIVPSDCGPPGAAVFQRERFPHLLAMEEKQRPCLVHQRQGKLLFFLTPNLRGFCLHFLLKRSPRVYMYSSLSQHLPLRSLEVSSNCSQPLTIHSR